MKRRLLIVDDDREATRQLANQLAGSQLIEICGEAASVDEAWAKLQQSRPDLVLLGGCKRDGKGRIVPAISPCFSPSGIYSSMLA
ncbi:response regulator transcription factor [Brevibacillus gelatini]